MEKTLQVIPLGIVNVYLINVGDGFILIDTGLSAYWSKLYKALMDAGCKPGMMKLVVLTHGDYDHIGNCKRLQQHYFAPIAIHKEDLPMIQNDFLPSRVITNPMMKLYTAFNEIVKKQNPDKFQIEPFTPDLFLEDGLSLAGFGLHAKVFHTPGHTKGSIVVLTDEGNLFAGDMLANLLRPSNSLFVENFSELKQSMECIKKMKASVIYPGHGNAFQAGKLSLIKT